MPTNEEKMFQVAESLGQLNANGQVKCFSVNEKGYARVLDIIRGCSICVHHLHDNTLIINLSVTPTAQRLYAEIVKNAILIFKNSFNIPVLKKEWNHAIDDNNSAEMYYVDVSDMSLDKIQEKLGQIKTNFGAAV